jgi:hypothetical protein
MSYVGTSPLAGKPLDNVIGAGGEQEGKSDGS